jgi:hypothetical protein
MTVRQLLRPARDRLMRVTRSPPPAAAGWILWQLRPALANAPDVAYGVTLWIAIKEGCEETRLFLIRPNLCESLLDISPSTQAEQSPRHWRVFSTQACPLSGTVKAAAAAASRLIGSSRCRPRHTLQHKHLKAPLESDGAPGYGWAGGATRGRSGHADVGRVFRSRVRRQSIPVTRTSGHVDVRSRGRRHCIDCL